MRLLERNAKREREAFLDGDLLPAARLKLHQCEGFLFCFFLSRFVKGSQHLNWVVGRLVGLLLAFLGCVMSQQAPF